MRKNERVFTPQTKGFYILNSGKARIFKNSASHCVRPVGFDVCVLNVDSFHPFVFRSEQMLGLIESLFWVSYV